MPRPSRNALREGSGTLTATTGNLWMDQGGGTTLTLQARPGLGNVRVTPPTATIGASDTANGIDLGGYLETNVLNLDAVGGSATLDVTGDLNIGNDGSGNAFQILDGSAPAAVSAGSIKVSIASTSGTADYNWIGTYSLQATLTATNLEVGYAGDKGRAENVGGTWTVTNTIIGDQAGSSDNYVSVYGSGTITNNDQMVVGLSGTGNTLWFACNGDPGSSIMAASPDDLEIGSLAGNGSVVGTVSVASGGAIAPTSGPGSAIGTLAVTGNVDFSPASGLLAIDMNAVDNDMLAVSGTLDITGATLDFLFDAPFSPVDRVLATYGSLTGTFGSITNLPSGWSIDYQYQGLNQIAAVPEPATLCSALAGLACGGFSLWRRRLIGGGRSSGGGEPRGELEEAQVENLSYDGRERRLRLKT